VFKCMLPNKDPLKVYVLGEEYYTSMLLNLKKQWSILTLLFRKYSHHLLESKYELVQVCISGNVMKKKHRALFIYLGCMGPCSVKYTFTFPQLTNLHIVSYKVFY
jgi:hypothetical protein